MIIDHWYVMLSERLWMMIQYEGIIAHHVLLLMRYGMQALAFPKS